MKTSKYYSVASQLIQHIRQHSLSPGSKLPSIRKIAELYSCSKNTANAALEYLCDEGIAESSERMGIFVTEDAWKDVNSLSMWLKYEFQGWHVPVDDELKRHHNTIEDNIITLSTVSMSPEFNSDIYVSRGLNDVQKRLVQEPLSNHASQHGLYSTREAISIYLANKGIEATPEMIFLTGGLSVSINIAVVAFLNRGMYLLIEDPSSVLEASSIAASVTGAKTVALEMDDEGIKIDRLSELQFKGRSLLIISSVHQYPTGISMSERRKRELLTICKKMEIPILEIDRFSDSLPQKSLKAMDKEGVVMYCGSFANIFALGVNVGWMVVPEYYMGKIADISFRSMGYHGTIEPMLVEALIRNGHYYNYINSSSHLFHRRIDLTDELLEKYLGSYVKWDKRHCGFLFWIEFPDNTIDQIFEKLEVLNVAKGRIFSRSSKYQNFISISPFSVSAEKLEQGISLIAEKIKEMSFY